MKITKGCPMCGEKEKVKLMCLNTETNEPIVWDEAEGNVYTWFHCYECGAEFLCDMPVHTPENMIEWWNTRKPMERIVEKLDKKVNFVDTKIEQKIRLGHQTESDQQFMNGIIYAIKIVEEEMGRI